MNPFMRLLYWRKNWRSFVMIVRQTVTVKWMKRCTHCFSKNLQFVEGTDRFQKWWCKDCAAMDYSFRCPWCANRVVQYMALKPHIYKEYRIGKYRHDKVFYKKTQAKWFEDLIAFHEEALKVHKKRYDTWKRKNKKTVRYG